MALAIDGGAGSLDGHCNEDWNNRNDDEIGLGLTSGQLTQTFELL